jgi:hypothetical protein
MKFSALMLFLALASLTLTYAAHAYVYPTPQCMTLKECNSMVTIPVQAWEPVMAKDGALYMREHTAKEFCRAQGMKLPSAEEVANWSRQYGATGILNPAPPQRLPRQWWQRPYDEGIELVEYSICRAGPLCDQKSFVYDSRGFTSPFFSTPSEIQSWNGTVWTSSIFAMGEVMNTIAFGLGIDNDWHVTSGFIQSGPSSRLVMCAP